MKKVAYGLLVLLATELAALAPAYAQSSDPCVQMGMIGGSAIALRSKGMNLERFQEIVGNDQSVNLATRLQYVQLAEDVWKMPSKANATDAARRSIEYCRHLYQPSR